MNHKAIIFILSILVSIFWWFIIWSTVWDIDDLNKTTTGSITSNTSTINSSNNKSVVQPTTITENKVTTDMVVSILLDKALPQEKLKPFLAKIRTEKQLEGAKFVELYYGKDKKTKEMMKKYNIKLLPAIIINNNKFNGKGQMDQFVKVNKDAYELEIGWNYNPETKEFIKVQPPVAPTWTWAQQSLTKDQLKKIQDELSKIKKWNK